jgi:hypothetical protein
MTTFGHNMKLTAARRHRDDLHKALVDGLGATPVPVPGNEDFAAWRLADDFNLGVYFVDEGEALDDDAQLLGPWLELCVDEVEAAHQRLGDLGVAHVPYARDPEHRYFRLPGGPVFRVAAGAS